MLICNLINIINSFIIIVNIFKDIIDKNVPNISKSIEIVIYSTHRSCISILVITIIYYRIAMWISYQIFLKYHMFQTKLLKKDINLTR